MSCAKCEEYDRARQNLSAYSTWKRPEQVSPYYIACKECAQAYENSIQQDRNLLAQVNGDCVNHFENMAERNRCFQNTKLPILRRMSAKQQRKLQIEKSVQLANAQFWRLSPTKRTSGAFKPKTKPKSNTKNKTKATQKK
jgi:hypothetical protein